MAAWLAAPRQKGCQKNCRFEEQSLPPGPSYAHSWLLLAWPSWLATGLGLGSLDWLPPRQKFCWTNWFVEHSLPPGPCFAHPRLLLAWLGLLATVLGMGPLGWLLTARACRKAEGSWSTAFPRTQPHAPGLLIFGARPFWGTVKNRKWFPNRPLHN